MSVLSLRSVIQSCCFVVAFFCLSEPVEANYPCDPGTVGGQWVMLSSCSRSNIAGGGVPTLLTCNDGSKRQTTDSRYYASCADAGVWSCSVGGQITQTCRPDCVSASGVYQVVVALWVQEFQCPGDAPSSCTDGIKNGNETGIDCGGSCPACFCPESIGGCNGTPKYCSDSPQYQDAKAFGAEYPDAKEFWYFISIDTAGKRYYCMDFYKNTSGSITLPVSISRSSINPSTSNGCMSEAAYNAVNNGVNGDCTLSANGKWTGFATNYTPGSENSGICIDPTTGAYINCKVSTTDVGDGRTVTQDEGTGRTIAATPDGIVVGDTADGTGTLGTGTPGTGTPGIGTGKLLCIDANKDGFDDVRGVACSSDGSSIGTTGQASKCVDVNKDMIDDVTGAPCFSDTVGAYKLGTEGKAVDYDTSLDTPKKSALSSLFLKAVTPLKNFVTGSRLQVSGSFCSQTIILLRRPYQLNLCPYESVFSTLGSFLLGASVLMSVYWVFK